MAQNNYGTFPVRRGQATRKRREHLKVAANDPKYARRAQAYENLGLTQLKLDQPADAEQSFLRALMLNAAQPRSAFELAEIYFTNGDFTRSKQYFESYNSMARPTSRSLWLGIRLSRVLAIRISCELRAGAEEPVSRFAGISALSGTGLVSDATPGPGAIVRAQRESRGLTQQDIADTLNLGVRVVEDMEAENWARLPPPAFTRGYLRAYAKLLDIDPDQVTRAFDAAVGRGETHEEPVAPRAIRPQGAMHRARSAAVLRICCRNIRARCSPARSRWSSARWLIVLWAVWPDAPERSIPERPTAAAAGIRADGGGSERRSVGPAPTEPAAGRRCAGIGADDDRRRRRAAPQTEVTRRANRMARTGSPATANDRLTFAFTDNCWVEIKDAQGSSSIATSANPATRLELVGQAAVSYPARQCAGRDAGVQRRARGVVAAYAQQRRHAGARTVERDVQSISGMRDVAPLEARRWQHVERAADSRARIVRLRRNPAAAARANGTVQSRSRGSDRRGRERDVQPARSRRRAVVVATGRYGGLRQGVSAAGPHLQSDAASVVSRADVPVRTAAKRPLSAIRADRRRSVRHGGTRRRRRTDSDVGVAVSCARRFE